MPAAVRLRQSAIIDRDGKTVDLWIGALAAGCSPSLNRQVLHGDDASEESTQDNEAA